MKKLKKQQVGENLIYLMVWTVIILVPILNSKMIDEEHVDLENVLTAWFRIAPYLLIFIIHNSLLAPRLLLHHKYIAYIVCDLVIITGVFGMVDLYEKFAIDPAAEIMFENRKASFTDLALHWNVVLGLFMCGANSSIKLMYQSLRDEQKMEALQHQNLQAEIDYLKYQINPHFFMNTLNNIHALIDIDTESAKDAVIELSKMMRYVLYDSGRQTISLQKDLQFLENYVRLMKIRYSNDLNIRIDYPRDLSPQISIPPLLLIVFVENAFKHGVSGSHPSFIHVVIRFEDRTACCTVTNSRRAARNIHAPGIGLKNVKKRLELIYGSDYLLDINDTDPAAYTVTLKIPLLNA